MSSTQPTKAQPGAGPTTAQPTDGDAEIAGCARELERATWRVCRRRFVGSEAGSDERAALALVEAWRKLP